ncbi:hypothetical protein L9F63_013420 [Diploptera punctata]|uniref:UNC93-like protein n=1 Tax=Diploptera punctata TaxID=6984 RepID=A0AAD8AB43_DIPPU|nr:hypothetical protein L9F63_013420 [Diploptera punctata]
MESEADSSVISSSSILFDARSIATRIELDKKKEKLNIIGNITIFSFGFMLHFTAVRGLHTLQRTLHFKNKLGKISMCIHYLAVATSSLLLTTAYIRRFGCKGTVVGSFIMYLPLCFSQFDSTPYTIIPTVIFCGLGNASLWVALSIYLIFLSRALKHLVEININNIIWRVFGVFNMIYEFSGVIGYAVISIGFIRETTNQTLLQNLTQLCAKAIFRRKQLSIIPFTIFYGCEKAFLFADYTEAYIACSWGIRYIGYVMIPYSVLTAISALLTGWLVHIKGKNPILICAAGLHMILFSTLFLKITVKYIALSFIVTGLWGICNGVWIVSITALYGIMFPHNLASAYSNYMLWDAVGYAIGYGYSSWVSIKIKVGILIAILVIGIAGYLDAEIRLRKIDNENLQA